MQSLVILTRPCWRDHTQTIQPTVSAVPSPPVIPTEHQPYGRGGLLSADHLCVSQMPLNDDQCHQTQQEICHWALPSWLTHISCDVMKWLEFCNTLNQSVSWIFCYSALGKWNTNVIHALHFFLLGFNFFFNWRVIAFTMLWWSLPHINESQSLLYTYIPCLLNLPSYSTIISHHTAPAWVPCVLMHALLLFSFEWVN